MAEDFNPYIATTSQDQSLSPVVIRSERGDSVIATVIRSGWLGRTIQLTGGVSAVVRYTPIGFASESVFVNDVLVLQVQNMDPRPWAGLIPRLEFEISDGVRNIPALIEVRGIIRVKSFRLTVAGYLVHSDGSW